VIRRRLVVLSALAVATLAGFSASQAVADDPTPSVPAPVERVEQYYAVGPSAEYGGDSGAIGVVPPMVWEVPGDAGATGVIEVSFQYRTVGSGPFVVSLGVRQVGGARVVSQPDQLTLAPAPDSGATTVRFLVPDLAAGQAYKAFVGVNSSAAGGHNKVTTRKMLVTAEVSPAG
jgi:hypothetical protein